MALAPVAYTLWQRLLRFDPADPIWPNRDRFVLSAGHASMLLYSLLFLDRGAGGRPRLRGGRPARGQPRGHRKLPPARLARARPPRVPLDLRRGDHHRAARPGDRDLGRDGDRLQVAGRPLPAAELFDFDVYAIAGDGCLMEGVSNEAASIAGHLKLDNLCWIYDNNHITIDGRTELAYDDDVAARFMGYGWNVPRVGDANDIDAARAAPSRSSRRRQARPTLIIVDSHIGWGSPHKQDTAAAHGEPLGEEEVRETKRAYGWPEDAQFLVPDGVKEHFADGIGKRGAELRAEWEAEARRLRRARTADLAAEIDAMQKRELPDGLGRRHPQLRGRREGASPPARPRKKVENAIAERAALAARRLRRPHRLDLGAARPSTAPPTSSPAATTAASSTTGSASTSRRRSPTASRSPSCARSGRPTSPSPTTRGPAIRLSALMELPVIHLFTHDSIGLGEDGPTHQPVEQLASLRAIPRPRRDPPRRRQRGRRGLAGGDRPHPPAGRPGPHPPERAGPRPLQVRLRRGAAARRLRARRRRGRRPRA